MVLKYTLFTAPIFSKHTKAEKKRWSGEARELILSDLRFAFASSSLSIYPRVQRSKKNQKIEDCEKSS